MLRSGLSMSHTQLRLIQAASGLRIPCKQGFRSEGLKHEGTKL